MWLWSGRIIVPRPKTGGIDCSELLRTASNSSNSEASTFNLLAVSEGIVTVEQQRPKCWCCSFLYLMIVWKWIFKQPYPWNMRSCLMWQNPGLLSTFTYHQKLDLVKSWKQSCRDAYAQGILYSIYLHALGMHIWVCKKPSVGQLVLQTLYVLVVAEWLVEYLAILTVCNSVLFTVLSTVICWCL